jgi:tetratricopeptide (TPR) repeat protein
MDWVTALFVLIPTILLLAQATSYLRRPNVPVYVRRLGFLCSVLSGSSFVLCLLLASGTLVLSSEFGLVMVQGPWARFGIAVLLIGSALGAGMGLHVCCLEAGRLTRPSWLLGPGLIVGFLATARLLPLNTGDTEAFRIYAYDLWWPPLVIYLSACLVESALSILRLHHRPVRLWVASALIAGLALLALSQPKFGDSTSAILWKSCLLVLLPASISVVTWLFFRIPRQRLTRAQRWIRQGLTVLPAGIGLLSGMSWVWGTPLSPLMTSWPWLLWLSWPLFVGLATPHQLYRAWRAGRGAWQVLPRPTFRQSIVLVAIAVLALSFAVLISFASLDRTLALAGFVIAWFLLVEAIVRGPLSRLLQQLIDRQQWSDMGRRVSHIGRSIGSCVGSLLSVPSMPVLIGKTLVGITILVVLSELPNAHKTLIQPFKVLGLPEHTEFGKVGPEREEAGQAISEQVVNTLGLLQQELRQEVMLSLQSDSGDEQERKKFELMSVGNSTTVSTALSKGPELEIGGVKIPMGLLFTPVQGPIRRLLGVRAINASVQVDRHGYSLLASSDAGETWKLAVSLGEISPPSTPISPEVIDRLAAELAFHIIKSDAVLAPAMTKSWDAFKPFKMGLQEWRKFETKQDYRALSSAIAYFREATQTDPGFAFAHYRLGLALQKDGQPGVAVKVFRASLRADPSLIPAHIAVASTLYDFERTSYLGEVGSPLDFLFKLPPQSERVANARDLWLEVLRLPGRGDSVANLGSAYYGLCRQAYRQGRRLARLNLQQERSHRDAENHDKTDPQARDLSSWGKRSDHYVQSDIHDHDMTPEPWYYMAYYYCKRAEAQYASLATTQHTNPEVKKGEAYVLQNLGVILANFQRPKKPSEGDQSGWECWATKLEANLNSREGLQYFLRVLDLLPDDYRIRCYAARAAYAFGAPRLLEWLQADPTAHLNLANSHRRLARVCASIVRLSPVEYGRLEQTTYRRYIQLCNAKDGFSTSAEHYQLALHEYDEVIRHEPMNIEALTGYADTVWERLIYAGHTKELRGWIEYYAERAVGHARQAAAFSSFPPDETIPAIIQATLGKAFLAQGKPEFAIEELKIAVRHVPNHPAYHEIHWALAQAYVCAASIDKSLGVGDEDVDSRQKRAVELLGDIRQQEGTREFQLYSYRPGVLDSPWGALICDPRVGMESMPDPPITLQATRTVTAHLNR